MDLSIVIPVYNEAESLPLLREALHQALDPLALSWEVILVDDGSTDDSARLLERAAAEDPEHFRAVIFRRNFGQTAAMSAGIDHAEGDVILFMDADLQNDPADIPLLLEKMSEGYDVVSGWRQKRQDTFVTRKLPSRVANWLIGKITGVRLRDYGCTLKAYRREVITGFRLYGEMHRFIPAYASWVGARIVEVPVRHHPRRFGNTKYGLRRTFKVMLDLLTVKLLTGFAGKPIYLFGGAGIALILLGCVPVLYAVLKALWLGGPRAHWALLGAFTMLAGLQCILLGLLAELLARTYHEAQGKRPYVIRRVIKGPPAQ